MMSLSRPSESAVRELMHQQGNLSFSYPDVGITRKSLPVPNSYDIDHSRVRLGSGEETFERAKQALRNGKMFDLGWLEMTIQKNRIAVDSIMVMRVRVLGTWFMTAARVVYMLDSGDDTSARFGFAYGTLPAHVERGEERFTVEWCHEDDTVWFDILAFSRPNKWITRIGYPYVRRLQKRFGRDSKLAMQRAVGLHYSGQHDEA